eukprot:TRINITY_DN7439_c0_g1_i1.p1 TRINITY_DN7439_c0_g1~~TRINITY_DN7439_c0_g1_i1.p1  ORF type:complete len:553 (-),score=129.54 TRINITY_DN7439_c0_g1_i1:53-1711(-)
MKGYTPPGPQDDPYLLGEQKVHQDDAMERLKDGAFILCMEVPVGTEFGVDYRSYVVGPAFKGVKMVPSGLHFVFYGMGHGMRCGFFASLSPQQVVVKRWDASTEDFHSGTGFIEDQVERLTQNVRSGEFDRNLGPYPAQDAVVWHSLSGFISAPILTRCGVPVGSLIVPGDCEDEPGPNTSHVVPFHPDQPRTPHFSEVALPDNQNRRLPGMTPEEITQYNLDKTKLLARVLRVSYDSKPEFLLGELQLSFVLFLQLSSYRSLNQWKRLVDLVCSCDDAVHTHQNFYFEFLGVLGNQLRHAPLDFLQEDVYECNFLRKSVVCLFAVLFDDAPCTDGVKPIHKRLVKRAEEFRRFLKMKFKFDAEKERDRYVDETESAPVVVYTHEMVVSHEDDDEDDVVEPMMMVDTDPPPPASISSLPTNDRFARLSSALNRAAEEHRVRTGDGGGSAEAGDVPIVVDPLMPAAVHDEGEPVCAPTVLCDEEVSTGSSIKFVPRRDRTGGDTPMDVTGGRGTTSFRANPKNRSGAENPHRRKPTSQQGVLSFNLCDNEEGE